MDFLKGRDLFRNYVRYQTRILAQFDAIAEEFGFRRIDANRSIREVFADLRREVSAVVTPMKRQGPVASEVKREVSEGVEKRSASNTSPS